MSPPFLNFDVQVEILKRLPVKSLIRFRSVCKAWKSLIDSSRFISRHNNVRHDRSSDEHHHLMIRYEVEFQPEKYVCFVDDDTFPQKRFDPPVPPLLRLLYGSRIIDSSCGLMCLKGYLQSPLDDSKTDMVLLWNPSVRKSITIVVPNDDPWFPLLGFGVCPKTKDPKLVKISNNHHHNQQVTIFTLSSRKWRCLPTNQLPRKSIPDSSQAVIGRFLYRIAFDGVFSFISSFDLTTEEFGEVPLPDSLRQSRILSISKLRESLVLIDYKGPDSTLDGIPVFHIWMMEDGSAFTKLFTIKNASDEWIVSILGFKRTGEPLVEIEVLDDDISEPTPLLAVYVPFLDHIKQLGICRDAFSFSICSYNESLLLLDQDDGRIVSAVEN